ncbi:MAG: sulfotransferase [Verrucomicrobiota bacterium]
MARSFITIVSGLPRSGTSLMMQMLAAGGMPALTDGKRTADQHNPRGYFELEAVKHTRDDSSWLAQARGKAVKVVHVLLPHLALDQEYRVLFMRRNPGEIIASQRVMLQQQGRPAAALSDSKLAEIYARQLAEVDQWLARQPTFQVLHLEHRDVIQHSLATAQRIAQFLGGDLAPERMSSVVEPDLYRQRQAPL